MTMLLVAGLIFLSACMWNRRDSPFSNPGQPTSPFQLVFSLRYLHALSCVGFFSLVMFGIGSASAQSSGSAAPKSCLVTVDNAIAGFNWSNTLAIKCPSTFPICDCNFVFECITTLDFASHVSVCSRSTTSFLDSDVDIHSPYDYRTCVTNATAKMPATCANISFWHPLDEMDESLKSISSSENILQRQNHCRAISSSSLHSFNPQRCPLTSLERFTMPCNTNAYVSRWQDIERSSLFLGNLFGTRCSDMVLYSDVSLKSMHNSEANARKQKHCQASPLTTMRLFHSQCRPQESLEYFPMAYNPTGYTWRWPDIEYSAMFPPGLLSTRCSDVLLAWLLLMSVSPFAKFKAQAVCNLASPSLRTYCVSILKLMMRAMFFLILCTSPVCVTGLSVSVHLTPVLLLSTAFMISSAATFLHCCCWRGCAMLGIE
jgi:hypothetical protein